jgi:nucleotide-binding universal stress UspA family protein
MFKHILVPLDGSKLAEAILPAAISLAEMLHAPVTLLHVIEQDASTEVHKDHHLTRPAEAQEYLDNICQTVFPASVKVDTHIHSAPVSDVSGSIIEHATSEFQPDLILLCSHGKGGMRNLLFGSIAQQVAAAGGIPVMLIKPGLAASSFRISRILVPLDNESIHDLALPYAEALSEAYQARLDILCVIPTLTTDSGAHAAAGTMLPVTAAAYLDITEEKGLPATAEIVRGDPALMIIKQAERLETDLILLGTHGRAGLDAFWNRSVTAGVAMKTNIPILLIPLTDL